MRKCSDPEDEQSAPAVEAEKPTQDMDKGMRLLYVSSRLNARDGSAVHGREFINGVMQLGHQIVTIPPLDAASTGATEDRGKARQRGLMQRLRFRTALWYLKQTNIYVRDAINLLTGVVNSARQFRELRGVVRSFAPEVIVYRQHLFDFAPLWVARTCNVPLVVEVNSFRALEGKFRGAKGKVTALVRWAEMQPVQYADYLFSVSRPIKDYIDRICEVRKATVIPNGVDVSKFDPARFDRDAMRRELGLCGKTVLGYVGSYKVWHGLDTTLDVIDTLTRKDARYHLVLIGQGKCSEEVRCEVSRRGLTQAVTQIATVEHEDIPRHIAAFDYALMTYPQTEDFYFSPLKMFEYLAMGIPVVATRVGQIGEILTHDETGILVDPPRAENFVEAIEHAEKNLDQVRAVGANARRLAVEQYSWQANAEKVIAVCRAVLERRERRWGKQDGVGVSGYD